MGHAHRTPRCSRPASARMPDTCWPRTPSAAPRRTRQGGGRATRGPAFPSSRSIAAGAAVAVEAGKDVEGVGSGHVVLLERAVDRCEYRPEITARLIGGLTATLVRG